MDLTGGLLNQTVTITPFTSKDVYGDRTYGTPVTYLCRIENVIRLIKNQQGETVVNTAQIYLAPQYTDASGNRQNTEIGYYDKVTLSDGSTPVILKINVQPDLDGSTAYIEVDT